MKLAVLFSAIRAVLLFFVSLSAVEITIGGLCSAPSTWQGGVVSGVFDVLYINGP
jgi:hypothetical protein